MFLLTINSGSSSLKYKIFQMPEEKKLYEGHVENIGFTDGEFPNHEQALESTLNKLFANPNIDINSINDIEIIGHRVVHGGDKFHAPTVIEKEVIQAIQNFSELAPLHNPANLQGIIACQKLIPNAKQIAVFDTAFHQTMKAENYTYAIPYKYYEKYKIRRYGFHGISHQFVYEKSQEIEKSEKVISCHIGNGASITAIHNGQVIENSMGFTPLAGLTMGTRSGDIDPEIVLYLMKKENLTPDEMDTILNKESGVLGIHTKTNHMKIITDEYEEGIEQSELAFKVYINSIVKYIGAYTALLNGVNTIIFTGGVLEKMLEEPAIIRKKICERLKYLGIELDENANNTAYKNYQIITTPTSKTKIIIIPTNEELMIAKLSYQLK